MEMINVSGYLAEEKMEIAKRHLIPKQLEEHGMPGTMFKFSKPAIARIIDEYALYRRLGLLVFCLLCRDL